MEKSTEPLFYVDACLNGERFVRGLIDSGCDSYAIINEKLSLSLELPRIKLPKPLILDGVLGKQGRIIHVTYFNLDIYGHEQKGVFAYVILG